MRKNSCFDGSGFHWRFVEHTEKWKEHIGGAVFRATRFEEFHYVSNGRDSDRDPYRTRISIAFPIRSLDLSVHLIAPTEAPEIFNRRQLGL